MLCFMNLIIKIVCKLLTGYEPKVERRQKEFHLLRSDPVFETPHYVNENFQNSEKSQIQNTSVPSASAKECLIRVSLCTYNRHLSLESSFTQFLSWVLRDGFEPRSASRASAIIFSIYGREGQCL